ncbi:MAG: tRNA (guanosine(46)-N7)-methyltransferase TrmB [Succiniclasticum sp.]|jgi:tRNA (guanine-N7-)-methyltransferase|nr:tRNA (guanosine(46)-N7)-methyltransferase TrmB [Succiniclasticum sp.]MEE3478644.1 tRNA (guanosine(46)-N7)-methyltransferase TrmB [Succiniclasticum sp.]
MRLRRKPWIDEALPEVRDEYIYLDRLDRFKGHWQSLFPGKELCMEIGCGKGAFITGMAALHPEKAFIGIESQIGVAYYPAKKAKDEGLTNMKMLCGDAAKLDDWFATGEVRTLYLNFSDPWPKARHAKRRLTHVNFLALYFKLMGPGGQLFFKTDNRPLFDFSVEQFRLFGMEIRELSYDLHHSAFRNEVQTEYEMKFSGRGTPINYCYAVFTADSGKDVVTRPPRNIRPEVPKD